MIDPLLDKLNKFCPVYALADDLVAVCPSKSVLHRIIKELEAACRERCFVINKAKSAIMDVVINGKQPKESGHYQGYPYVRSYKYLGIHINGALNFQVDLAK